MFHSYEFSFDGESSLSYGLMIYDLNGTGQDNVSFGNKGSIIETRTNRRIQPLHFGVNYNKEPLKFDLVFGTDVPLDRYDLQRISYWLTGHQTYRWLTIDQPDLENVQFRCIVTELKPLSVGWLPYAFQATIVCDCPYAYSYPFEMQYTISGATDLTVMNESTVHEHIKPVLTFIPANGTTSLSIINHSDGNREFKFTNIPVGTSFVVDNNNGIIQGIGYSGNLYDLFNFNFFRLVDGANALTVHGDGTLMLSGRFYQNVAG